MNISQLFERTLIVINWDTVRSLATLKILTKASYSAFVIVPLVAAIWPIFEILLKYPLNAVADLRRKLTDIRKYLEVILGQENIVIEDRDLAGILIDLEYYAGELYENLSSISQFPSISVSILLLSFFVIIGHLIFQIWCPYVVAKYNLRSFIQEEVAAYLDSKNEAQLTAAKAIVRRFRSKNVLVPDRLRYINKDRTFLRVHESDQADESIRTIEWAALLEYYRLSGKLSDDRFFDDAPESVQMVKIILGKPVLYSFLFYVLSALIAIVILCDQVTFVLVRAGWL